MRLSLPDRKQPRRPYQIDRTPPSQCASALLALCYPIGIMPESQTTISQLLGATASVANFEVERCYYLGIAIDKEKHECTSIPTRVETHS